MRRLKVGIILYMLFLGGVSLYRIYHPPALVFPSKTVEINNKTIGLSAVYENDYLGLALIGGWWLCVPFLPFLFDKRSSHQS